MGRRGHPSIVARFALRPDQCRVSDIDPPPAWSISAALLVARGDAEGRDDLGLVRLGVGDVGAGAAAEPAGGFVVADEDAGVVLAVPVLDPDLVALQFAALVSFLWFLGSVFFRLRAAEGSARLSAAALAGGV